MFNQPQSNADLFEKAILKHGHFSLYFPNFRFLNPPPPLISKKSKDCIKIYSLEIHKVLQVTIFKAI